MKKFIKAHLYTLLGIAFGAIAGYLFWKLVGCASGTCVITSRPLNSTLYGVVMGGLLFTSFKKDKQRTT